MTEALNNRAEQIEASFLTQDVATALLETGKQAGGQITYDKIVGYDHDQYWTPSQVDTSYIIRPRGEALVDEPDRIEELQQAKDGLAIFLGVMLDAHAKGADPSAALFDRNWLKESSLDSSRKARLVVYKQFGNQIEKSWQLADGTSLPLVPYLGYQNGGKPKTPEEIPGAREKGDFLHFGTLSKEVNSDDFVGSVRMYLNPKLEHTALAAGLLASDFYNRMGYVPRGKFVEDVTAQKSEDRKDRLIFWTHSPEELTTLTKGIKRLSEERPELFEGRSAMALGKPVAIDGRELPTLRLTQDPPTVSGETVSQPSFNSSRLPLINKALAGVLNDGVSRTETEQVNSFIASLQDASLTAGINVRDFNFNAEQDMGVVEAALAAAA